MSALSPFRKLSHACVAHCMARCAHVTCEPKLSCFACTMPSHAYFALAHVRRRNDAACYGTNAFFFVEFGNPSIDDLYDDDPEA